LYLLYTQRKAPPARCERFLNSQLNIERKVIDIHSRHQTSVMST
jgi:hypothetical protein